MIKKKSKESFIAFKEALKFKYLSILYGLLLELWKSELVTEKYCVNRRDSWQMWENFSHVAMDVGNIDQVNAAINL